MLRFLCERLRVRSQITALFEQFVEERLICFEFGGEALGGGELGGEREGVGIKFANAFGVGSGPDGDAAGEVGGDDAGAVVIEGGAQGDVAEELELLGFCAVAVPQGNGLVASTGD